MGAFPINSSVQSTRSHIVAEEHPADDVKHGALWLGVGVLVTLGTFIAADSSPDGGVMVVAYGPMIYGGFRLLRGLMREIG